MYIETRTTADEVIADVLKELEYKANSVHNAVVSIIQHPSYSTKPMLRAEVNELMGAYGLAIKVVGGVDNLPEPLRIHVTSAREAAVKIVGKLS